MRRVLIRVTAITASDIRALAVAAAAIALLAATLAMLFGHVAQAQIPGAPVVDARPGVPWPAPVGHLQPRRTRVPSAARQDENDELSGERSFDQKLRICRGC